MGVTPAVLTRYYEQVGVKGRPAGIRLDSSYVVGYGYDQSGRMQSVAWTANGASDTAIYSRIPGSELLAGYTTQSGLAATYEYEPKRDLKTQVKNGFGGTTISQYDYQYDAIGRRTSVANSGSAFAQPAFSRWGYNDRNELIESGRYLGTNVTNVSQPVTDEYRAYVIDPIGNRSSSSEGTAAAKSNAANALNEYTTVGGVTHVYDADGNLMSDGARRFVYDAENRLVLVEPLSTSSGAVRNRSRGGLSGRSRRESPGA